MSELSQKELSIIDNYAVHILAGLINSPHFDPSEYKSTAEMMMQQCDIAYVYAEKLLISRNRFTQDKRRKTPKNKSDDYFSKKEDVFMSFFNKKLRVTNSPLTPMKSRDGITGIFDSYVAYCQEIGIGEQLILNLSRFGKSLIKTMEGKGLIILKTRNNKGISYNLEIINDYPLNPN